jgi:hypothetical protein
MDDLKARGKFVDGSPLQPNGKVLIYQAEASYAHDGDSVNGYAIIKADDIEEAMAIVQKAPQVTPAYGSAKAEIRPLLSLRWHEP